MKRLSKKQYQINKILKAIYHGEELERDGKIIVNNIGLTTYVSYNDLTGDELIAVGKQKKQIMKGWDIDGS